MDGLMIDSEPFWRRAEIQGFGEVGITLTEDDCRETMGYRLDEVVELWYTRQPWHSKSKKEVENRILELVIDLVRKEGEPLPGLLNSIDLFKSHGVKLALASSSPMNLINAVLDRLKIRGEFEVVHSAEFEEWGKPHPAVFISAAKKLDVAPQNCLVLEDSFHGLIAGLAAKMRVVAVPDSHWYTNEKLKAADLVLKSLTELSPSVLMS